MSLAVVALDDRIELVWGKFRGIEIGSECREVEGVVFIEVALAGVVCFPDVTCLNAFELT